MTDQIKLEEPCPSPPVGGKEASSDEVAPREADAMDGQLEWAAAIGTIVAAGMVAADMGRRATGWGFVLFCIVAMMWIASGLIHSAASLIIQNAALLAINAWGVWRYLLNPKRR